MLQAIAKWLLYSFMGWKKDVRYTLPNKAIICLAPHTSNYDFLIGQLYATAKRTIPSSLGSYFSVVRPLRRVVL